MIPTIETIIGDLVRGLITEKQAIAWINRHLELAVESALETRRNMVDGELRRFLRNEDGRIFWQYSDGSHRGLNSLDVMLINKALEASLPSAPDDLQVAREALEKAAIAAHMFPSNPHMQGPYNSLLPHQKRRVDDLHDALSRLNATKGE